jgi:flavin-dependent dehydrogenase
VGRQPSEIEMVLDQSGREIGIVSRYLVGADGPLSRVRNSLSPDFDRKLRMIPNYEEWYAGDIDLEPKWLNVFLDAKLTSYFASVFHKDGKIIVVTGAKQSEPVKDYFQELVNYLKQSHRFVIREKLASYGCVLHDMSATNNFHLGDGNVLLVGEAGGFSRALGEGISSAFVTGRAAGEAILKSMETGRPASGHYKESAAPEIDLCNQLNRILEDVIGLNPFTR